MLQLVFSFACIFACIVASQALSTDEISTSTTPQRDIRSHTTIVVCSIIGALLCIFLGLGALLYHYRCRRSRGSTRSRSSSIESFVAGYSTEGSHCEYQEILNPVSYYPAAVLPPVPSLVRSTGSRPGSPSALSFLTIPGSLYESSVEDSYYSPAAPSSNMYSPVVGPGVRKEFDSNGIEEEHVLEVPRSWSRLVPVRRVPTDE